MVVPVSVRRMLGVLLLALCVLAMVLPACMAIRLSETVHFTPTGRVSTGLPSPPMPAGEVNVNEDGLEKLVTLPGIGEVYAQAIIDERELNGPFLFPEELLAVRGIGEKRLAAIREYITLGEVGE